ncbi:MAG TPA: PLP-dependent aminotransferase family protein, partial [Ruminococcaceae bacterium]|nr:PLP-dependent aminotransferase family protein [Oscillospiraceae bacterium]
MEYKFSNRVSNLQPSLIREFFKYNGLPGYIPFSAGNPSSETFPAEAIEKIAEDIFKNQPIAA